jgi:hypothetical protein
LPIRQAKRQSPSPLPKARKEIAYEHLSISESGEVSLTLRGIEENRILATVRRWPYWRRVALEHHPIDTEQCLAVTLFADQIHETIVRDILKRSFGMTFPQAGGACELLPEPSPPIRLRRRGS